jgi:hypothetical protein
VKDRPDHGRGIVHDFSHPFVDSGSGDCATTAARMTVAGVTNAGSRFVPLVKLVKSNLHVSRWLQSIADMKEDFELEGKQRQEDLELGNLELNFNLVTWPDS